MKIFVVTLLAALMLLGTASVATAQDSGADTADSVVEATSGAEAAGNTDWIRTIGILGIAGIWGARGINSVRRSRREREQWAAEAAAKAASGDLEAPQAS